MRRLMLLAKMYATNNNRSRNAVRNYLKMKNNKAHKSVLGRPLKLSPIAARALERFSAKGHYNPRQVHDGTVVGVSVRTVRRVLVLSEQMTWGYLKSRAKLEPCHVLARLKWAKKFSVQHF